MMNLSQIRSNNLRKIIDNSGLSLSIFCKKYGFHSSNIGPILNGKKRFTDLMADKWERKLLLESGELSLSNILSLKPEDLYLPYTIVYDEHNLSIEQNKLHSNIEIFTINDGLNYKADFYYPDKINVAVIDKTDVNLVDGNIYYFEFENCHFFRLFKDNMLVTNDDNFYVNLELSDKVKIIGKLLLVKCSKITERFKMC